MKQAESSTGETPSDAELILQVRSGDRDAFGVLYERHAGAARALARQYVSPADAEDVVADAFSTLFEMLRRGAGPDAGFRPYLYTVVRHRAFDVSRGAARTRPSTDDEIESVLGRVASNEDPALLGFERSVIAKAYVDLPERWREVLWYVLVDDLKPAQVAPVLGLSPNGVSALLYRAKEALRAGYLQQHLTHAPSDMCRTVNPLLGGYVRESLSKRETTKIEGHLATCGTCSALVLELHDIAHAMKTVIAPLVLGAGGLALVGAGAPIGGLALVAKAGAGAGAAATSAPAASVPAASVPAASVTVGAASTGTFSGAVSSAVSVTAGALASAAGGSLAAGAIAVAAVGVVAALQIASPADAEPVADSVVTDTATGDDLPAAEEVQGKPVLPTDTEPRDETSTYLVVDYTDASQPLLARETQSLALTVQNSGDAVASGTQLKVTLPDGLTLTTQNGPFGTGVGRVVSTSSTTDDSDPASSPEATPGASAGSDVSADGETQAEPSSSPSSPATVGPITADVPARCLPTEQQNVLLCSLGDLGPGQAQYVDLPVRANSGGDYPVGAEVWADGIEHIGANLPDRTVAPFGAELSASTDDVSLSSPGTAVLPVRVVSTGDQTVPADWAVEVTLPDGVTPASAQPELSCGAAAMPNAWLCAPLTGTDAAAVQLDPGRTVEVALSITTAAASSGAAPTTLGVANVRPVLEGYAHSSSATLVATSAWVNAADGVSGVTASCLAQGGAGVADAAVGGTYTNTTQRSLRVALEAAGGRASSSDDIAPGESTRLSVSDGLRLPAGQAVFVLATAVDGQMYETRVAAGDHTRADCYRPDWTADTTVQTVNLGGTVGVEGTLTNKSGETLSAVMSVPVGDGTIESVRLPVSAGSDQKFTVDTGRMHVPPGDVTFRLSRDGADADGDLPDGPIVPKDNPTAHHNGALIAPAFGGDKPVDAGICTFDAAADHSVQTFSVTADNRQSSLPVRFHVGDVTKTVPAGQAMKIEYPVVWGTETATLTAGEQTLGEMDVSFKSCAELSWPSENMGVSATSECVEADWSTHFAAAVDNRTGRDWAGVLVRVDTGETGPETVVPAGATTELGLTRPLPISTAGQVSVRLTRQLEGEAHTVEQSFWVPAAVCGGVECEPSFETASSVSALNWSWTRPESCAEVGEGDQPDDDGDTEQA
ncbi:RNA polymerase sigma factor [Promicromonospora sp. Populi]|uniref:RNA polymerase sigma factor n=1 Tax=Promicromonospora sp. Populi TaxID=3239420 RepID=UPI0034E1E71C